MLSDAADPRGILGLLTDIRPGQWGVRRDRSKHAGMKRPLGWAGGYRTSTRGVCDGVNYSRNPVPKLDEFGLIQRAHYTIALFFGGVPHQ